MSEAISFFSDGHRLAGDLHLPTDAGGAARLPAVAICPGLGGRRVKGPTRMAELLAASGRAVLTFDVRGHGDSEGPANRLDPQELVRDVRAAIDFLMGHVAVDAQRVSAMGMLTGAAAALQAVSEDNRIAAAVAFFPFGDGGRWLRSLRRYGEWRLFQEQLRADRATRARTGISQVVDADEVIMRGPERLETDASGGIVARDDAPRRRNRRWGLDTADAILVFRPEDHFHRIAPRPVMVVAVEDDLLMPIEEVERAYARLGEPKSMLVVPGISHHEIGEPEHLRPVMAAVGRFLDAVGAAVTDPA